MTPAGAVQPFSHSGEVLLAHHVALLAIPAIVVESAQETGEIEKDERELIERAFEAKPDTKENT